MLYDSMTFLSLITIIVIIALLWVGNVSIVCALTEEKMPVWATHLGYYVGEESRRMSDHLVCSMTWTCGSWDLHMLQLTSRVCHECQWHALNQTRSYRLRLRLQ
jgi:hypothetical protein